MSFPWPYVNSGDDYPRKIMQLCPHLPEGTRYVIHTFDITDDDSEVKDQIVKNYIEQNLAFAHDATMPQVKIVESSIHKCAWHPVRPKAFWVVQVT